MARKHPQRKQKRQVIKTALLIVGEGPDDQAFIKHMRQQLLQRHSGIKATIEKQSGGSPGNIIENATRKYQSQDFDQRFIVLDADIPPSQQERDKARKNGYSLIFWAPICLEGALLDVLGEGVNAHETAQQLKNRLHPQLNGAHTHPDAYTELFPKEVLEKTPNASVVAVKRALVQDNP